MFLEVSEAKPQLIFETRYTHSAARRDKFPKFSSNKLHSAPEPWISLPFLRLDSAAYRIPTVMVANLASLLDRPKEFFLIRIGLF